MAWGRNIVASLRENVFRVAGRPWSPICGWSISPRCRTKPH